MSYFPSKIVDIEVTDKPRVQCAGDTFDSGGIFYNRLSIVFIISDGDGCKTSCRINEIQMQSGQNNKLTCYDDKDSKMEEGNRVPVGGYCIVSCDDKPGKVSMSRVESKAIVSFHMKVAYPKDGRTVCRPNSDWSDKVSCTSTCSADMLGKGLLDINAKSETKEVDLDFKCQAFDGNMLSNKDFIISGKYNSNAKNSNMISLASFRQKNMMKYSFILRL